MHACLHACTFTCMYMYMHAHVHACTFTCMHMYKQILSFCTATIMCHIHIVTSTVSSGVCNNAYVLQQVLAVFSFVMKTILSLPTCTYPNSVAV